MGSAARACAIAATSRANHRPVLAIRRRGIAVAFGGPVQIARHLGRMRHLGLRLSPVQPDPAVHQHPPPACHLEHRNHPLAGPAVCQTVQLEDRLAGEPPRRPSHRDSGRRPDDHRAARAPVRPPASPRSPPAWPLSAPAVATARPQGRPESPPRSPRTAKAQSYRRITCLQWKRGRKAPSHSIAHKYLVPQCSASAPDINGREQEQPDHVDKVPVPRRRLEPDMLLGGEVALVGRGSDRRPERSTR